MKKSILTFALWLVTGLTLSLFSQIIPVNQSFSSDTIINPFKENNPVYSLTINCGVQLLSDTSLVRVVLIDNTGNHYLIYEAYPLITSSNNFSVEDVCDETCFIDGIIPDSIRIDIIDAFITIDNVNIDTGYLANAKILQAQAKWNTDSAKIVVMNQRIVEEHMYWRAGSNYFNIQMFQVKESKACFPFYNLLLMMVPVKIKPLWF